MGRDQESVEEAEGLSLVEGQGEAVVVVHQVAKGDGEEVLNVFLTKDPRIDCEQRGEVLEFLDYFFGLFKRLCIIVQHVPKIQQMSHLLRTILGLLGIFPDQPLILAWRAHMW